MPTPRPGSNMQILSQVSSRHLIPVVDVDRTDLPTPQYIPASALGIVAGAGAPANFVAAIAAVLVHNSLAANADLTFTALATGPGGNAFTVTVDQPVSLNAVLGVTWDGTNAIISLPTDGAGAPVAATATQVKAAWDASAAAAYISVVVQGTGAGAVDVLAETNLATGANAVAGTNGSWLYVDTVAPALYINTGTLDAPVWTAA